MRIALAAAAVAALVATSCANLLGIEEATRETDGPVNSDDGGDAGEPVDATTTDGCAPTSMSFTVLPAEVLVMLDRSASMTSPLAIPPSIGSSRWAEAGLALRSWRDAQPTNIEAALMVFPGEAACGLTAGTRVGFAPSNGINFTTYLANSAPPNDVANGQAALIEAENIVRFVDAPGGRHIIMITDSMGTCSGESDPGIINAMTALKNAGNTGYVIGFLPQDPSPPFLMQLQSAGGSGLAPMAVGTPAELANALTAINADILRRRCAFQLPATVTPTTPLLVRTGSTTVARDPANGYDFVDVANKPGMIKLHGTACTAVGSGALLTVSNPCP